jgi:hypothetical protein
MLPKAAQIAGERTPLLTNDDDEATVHDDSAHIGSALDGVAVHRDEGRPDVSIGEYTF